LKKQDRNTERKTEKEEEKEKKVKKGKLKEIIIKRVESR
jgi:hypothetical protein